MVDENMTVCKDHSMILERINETKRLFGVLVILALAVFGTVLGFNWTIYSQLMELKNDVGKVTTSIAGTVGNNTSRITILDGKVEQLQDRIRDVVDRRVIIEKDKVWKELRK